MATMNGPMLMDRTEELYQQLEQSPKHEARMMLEMFDFVLMPKRKGIRARKVVGPTDLLALQSDERIVIHAVFEGARPAKPNVYSIADLRKARAS